MELVTILWVILAVVLFIGELWLPSFFLAWFSIGAVVSAVASYLGVSFVGQWAVFVVVSFVLLIYSRRFAEKISKPQPVKMNVDAYIGETGVVLESIDPEEDTGLVRVKKERWRADSEEYIEKGERVEVIGVEGVHLVVRKKGGE